MEQAARVVSLMDSDDAVDLLENLEDEDKNEIVEHLDEEAQLHLYSGRSDSEAGDEPASEAGGRKRQYHDYICS